MVKGVSLLRQLLGTAVVGKQRNLEAGEEKPSFK
jgi:hypothetical protein